MRLLQPQTLRLDCSWANELTVWLNLLIQHHHLRLKFWLYLVLFSFCWGHRSHRFWSFDSSRFQIWNAAVFIFALNVRTTETDAWTLFWNLHGWLMGWCECIGQSYLSYAFSTPPAVSRQWLRLTLHHDTLHATWCLHTCILYTYTWPASLHFHPWSNS